MTGGHSFLGIFELGVIKMGGHPFLRHRDVVLVPGLLPIFLHGCEIKSGSGLGTRLYMYQSRP